MKKIFLLACLVVSATIYSQELDEAYLQSLPESVREDVLNKIEAKDELDKPVYRRASTFIDKDIDEDEDQYEEIGNELFGSDFFDVMQTSFMPINEPNLDSSYVLDFGDVLEVRTFDFEGSSIRGVESFYSQFEPQLEIYAEIFFTGTESSVKRLFKRVLERL